MVINAGIHTMNVRIANQEDPDQTASIKQSDLGLPCLSRPFCQITSVRNFRTCTVNRNEVICMIFMKRFVMYLRFFVRF